MRLSALLLGVVIASSFPAATGRGDDAPTLPPKPTLPGGTPAEQVKALEKHYLDARAAFKKLADAAATAEDRQKIAPLFPNPETYAPLFLQVAGEHPRDPAAVDALLWVVRNTINRPGAADAPYARARAALVRDHLGHSKIGLFCLSLKAEPFDPEAAGVLRRVRDKHPEKAARAQATYALARLLLVRADWAESLRAGPYADAPRAAELAKHYGEGPVADLRRGDPEAMRKEADALLAGLTADKESAAAPVPLGEKEYTVGELAGRELFELRHLRPGRPAPEIAAEGIDGKPMKLSDYRGKVVAVVFWASWCGPCMAAVPHERELVERMKGRPFALVGVNGDETLEAARKAAERTKMTWPSFWNGEKGADGPITEAWNVHGWPTAYLIDHRGVIVRKVGMSKADDDLIEAKVKEAEAAAKK